MFWGYFVNNLDFGFKGVGISMVCGDWMGKVLIRMIGVAGIMVGMVGRLKLVGFVYEGGKVDSAWEFSSKNGNKFQKPPPIKCIIFT